MPTDFELRLGNALKLACNQAGELEAREGLQMEAIEHLERPKGFLQPVPASEIDWRHLATRLKETAGLQEQLSGAVDALEDGDMVKAMVSDFSGLGDEYHDPVSELWWEVAMPILRRHHAQEGWGWDEDAVLGTIARWTEAQELRFNGGQRTLAPLRCFEGPPEPIGLDEGVEIRPFTDSDREALWHSYGEDQLSSPILDGWSHVIDCRWQRTKSDPSFGHGPGKGLVTDALRALRLHHPGMTETTLSWTCPYPKEEKWGIVHQSFISWSRNDYFRTEIPEEHYFGTDYPDVTAVGTEDGEDLRRLFQRLRASRSDSRLELPLRRFDAAFAREDDEDRLIDLWIAFEALLLPDGRSELSYRAALRIAQLAADNGADRKEAFQQARLSYNCRSKVVHGEAVKADLGFVVEQTRQLARKVLRAWVLTPPAGGVDEIDESLFD